MNLQSVGNRSTASRGRARSSASTRSLALMLSVGSMALLSAIPALAADTWTGATSSDWFTAGNWADGSLPTAGDAVVIDTNAPNPTVISTGNAFAAGFTMGSIAASSATATVTGAGSQWTNTGAMTVGVYGSATLDVSNHGIVSGANALIGKQSSSIGIVTVDGSGSQFTNTGNVTIAESGTGTLNITNGGAVTGEYGYLGFNGGSTGTANVDGTGSSWTNNNDLYVGLDGIGSLVVTNGGAVTSLGGLIAFYNGGSGDVTVDGPGSTWVNSADLMVGGQGTGALTITNGGVVSNVAGLIATNGSGTGAVTVDGAGSEWNNSSDLSVGYFGTGTLDVTNGGLVTSQTARVGTSAGGNGSATIDGAGSTWTNSGDMYVGNYDQSIGTLAIRNGGAVSSAWAYVGYQGGSVGTVTIDGAGSSWTSTSSTYVGVDGTGALAITNGGSASGLSMVAGFHAGATGTMTVDGAGASLNATSDIVLGVFGEGSLTLSDGGVASATGHLLLANQSGGVGTFNIGAAAGSAAQAAGTLSATGLQFGPGTGTVNFNHTEAAYGFSAPITGLGTINQIAGTTDLAGNSSGFTGATHVTGGSLYVNGSLGGAIDVTGGLLGGSGALGAVTVASGGTIAPGNSIGTINVTDATLSAGSVYAVELESGGTSDLINATGVITINGGTVLAIAYPDYALGTTYTIATATGGITGTFDSASIQGTAFIAPVLSYDANNVYFDLVQLTFADLAKTPNQTAAALGADSLGAGNVLYDAVAALATAGEVQSAYDAISGEIHASAKTALIEDSRFVRDAALGRLRSGFDAFGSGQPAGETGLWMQGFGAFGRSEGDGNAAAMAHGTGGLFLGSDSAMIDNWQFGVLAGVSKTGFDVMDRASSGAATSYHIGAYGGTELGDLAFRFGGAHSWHTLEASRTAAFTGFSNTLASGYTAGTGQVFGELAYGIDAGTVKFEPFVNFAYVDHRTDAFAETGGVAALAGTGDMIGATFATLGLRAETEIALGETVQARLKAVLGWRHAFGDMTPESTQAFAGGTGFTVSGVPITQDAALLELGLDVDLTPMSTLAVTYSGQLGAGAGDHTLKANFGARF